MAEKNDVKWALWVFAGPGALPGTQVRGVVLPLARELGDRPAGVSVLAQTVGAPSLLQRLTGEWPTERLRGEAVVSRGERDLGRFVAWADKATPKGAKRALIVLGDVQQAIGEAPKALVPGGDRPPYPAQITIKKSGTTTTADAQGPSRNNQTLYSDGTTSQTIQTWLGQLTAQGDYIQFGSGSIYTRTSTAGQYSIDSTGDYYTIDASAASSRFKISRHRTYPTTITIGWNTSDPVVNTTYRAESSTPDQNSQYINGGASGDRDTIAGWLSQLGATSSTAEDTIKFGSDSYSYQCKFNTDNYYMRAGTSDDTYYTITASSRIKFQDTGEAQPPQARSIDDAGRVRVSPAERRIDALVAAMGDRQVDLLVSDDDELVRIAALRRLATRTTVLLGAPQSVRGTGQPLKALLAALGDGAELSAENLAARIVERADRRTGLVALKTSGARRLMAALDELAQQALASADSPIRQCIVRAWSEGGDLSSLLEALETVDSKRATNVAERARETIVAPVPEPRAPSLGIRLDGRGLQLGATSDWVRLLDVVGGYGDAHRVRSTLADLQVLTANNRLARGRAPAAPTEAGCVLEYAGPTRADGDAASSRAFERFVERALESCVGRHVVLVVRGTWTREHPGSITFDVGPALAITDMARCLHDALGRRGRGRLASIIFEDFELLRIENAYELRDVAHVLLTQSVEAKEREAELPTLEQLRTEMGDVIVDCERSAAEQLGVHPTDSIMPFMEKWRHKVAVRLATELSASSTTDHGLFQGIDLDHIEGLCRKLDRMCHRMYDNLDNVQVLDAIHAGDGQLSLIGWIYNVQNALDSKDKERKGTSPEMRQTTSDLYEAWGLLYNWLSTSEIAQQEGGAPLWIRHEMSKDPEANWYAMRLRVTIGSHQPRAYRNLSFHRDVSLYALLTAARVLGEGELCEQWGLLKMGLAYGPEHARRQQLERLIEEPRAAHYFRALGVPPLLSLAIDEDRGNNAYELRLTSTDSRAALLRRRSIVDLDAVDRSLEGLAYVISGSMASREGFAYLDGLGASLAEDVLNELRKHLEQQRVRMLRSGRCREAHLALELPRGLMRYPWEVMQLPGLGMLAEQFAVGRQMWTDREPRRAPRDESIRVLVVADPPTPLGGALPGAYLEGTQVQRLCAQLGRELQDGFDFVCDAWVGKRLTRTILRQWLRTGNYDVLHFAGHGKYDDEDPDRSGWALSDGLLTVTELSNTLASCEAPPWLIYANACDVGMLRDPTSSGYHADTYGLADACIRAGVNAYIAPMWRIHDESARVLATEFYRRLLLERGTVGAALQLARIQVDKMWKALRGDSGLGDISWTGMVLYGNPSVRFRETAS